MKQLQLYLPLYILFYVPLSSRWRRALRMRRAANHVSGLLLEEINKACLRKKLFAQLELEDNLNDRFELMMLIASLVIERLGVRHATSRALIETLINEIDGNYREMGVGDMRFAKIMKKTIAALMTRLIAYHEAKSDVETYLALERFIYFNKGSTNAKRLLTKQIQDWRALLAKQSLADMLSDGLDMPLN